MIRASMKIIALLGVLGACSAANQTDPAADPEALAAPSMRVTAIGVNVPLSLQVSEQNSYYPGADIVWRGEPIGDRHAQVKAIFEEAAKRGVAAAEGVEPAVVDIQVSRFHALTEKARYTVGGVHAITFSWQARDAATGDVIFGPKLVRADLEAFGGDEAIAADARGETQKVRITAHLAEVMRQELAVPGGYQNERLGLIQRLNRAR